MSVSDDIIELMEKYLEGTALPEERAQVLEWYRAMDLRNIRIPISTRDEMERRGERILSSLQLNILASKVSVRRSSFRWMEAAAAILFLIGGLWLYRMHQVSVPGKPVTTLQTGPKDDVPPGRQGAILTLSDGSKKILDSLHDGVIATQGATSITLQDGKIFYGRSAAGVMAVLTYNTMTTPRGRQYQMVLPDGTKVWLNAASSLTYPTAFTGPDRTVEMTGEAYFEVQHQARPFKVRVAGQTIEDLGTHFNINAYNDEASLTTTLLEGSISVNSKLLEPGQQATLSSTGRLRISEADTSRAIAWRNDVFAFENSSMPAVMRQLERWYDIDVNYQGADTSKTFSGNIRRSLTLSQVLRVLTIANVHYRIEGGKKLIILPGQ